MSIEKLLPPCTYQGGKQRLACQIVDKILETHKSDFVFYDFCCGSGAVSLELLSRDLPNVSVIMIDKGPFGLFWEKVGQDTFDYAKLEEEVCKLPSKEGIGEYLRELSKKPVDADLYVYHYLLLQAGSFGSKQIWIEKNKWCNNTFRSYWLPTATSSRRSPVNPMMPMPDTLCARVSKILQSNKGRIQGYNIDAFDAIYLLQQANYEKVIYIDPPYRNTTGYGYTLDLLTLVEKVRPCGDVYISEGYTLEGADFSILFEQRSKGNVNGNVKKESVCETLSVFQNKNK